jgi:hypothetical protein
MNTSTFAVSKPHPAAVVRPPAAASEKAPGSPLWPWVAAAGVLLLLIAGVASRRRPLARAGRSH